MGKVTILYVDGTVDSAPASGISLEKLQQMTGGYIERIPMFDEYEGERCIALCDEEGKLKGQQTNVQATQLWYEQPRMRGLPAAPRDRLVGAVVILTGADLLRNW